MTTAPTIEPPVLTWQDDVVPWIDDVLAGRAVVGELVRCAVQRHVRDLESGPARGLYFDEEAANTRLEFCACQPHVEGSLAAQPFVPEPAQAFIFGSVHGWKRSDGHRRFTLAYIEVGKKFGKTFMIAGEGLWGTGFDGEQGGKAFSIATKEDQAKLSWDPARRMIELSPELREVFRVNRNRIIDDRSGSYWTALGRDSDSEDGKNPSLLLVDELHRHPDGELYNTVRLSMATREQPLTWIITTAGAGRESFCWSVHVDCERVVRGVDHDDSIFVFIATKDQGDDWRTEVAWRKANPNVGVSVKLEFLQSECEKAKRNPRLENDFRRFFCNEWTEQAVRWLQMAEWDACSDVQAGNWAAAKKWRELAMQALAGERCITGLDLGRTGDLTAVSHVFAPRKGRVFLPGKWIVLPHFWLPDAKLDEKGEADGMPYRVWADMGFVTLIEGNAVTSDELEPLVREFCKPFRVVELPYDPAAGARDVAMKLQGFNLPVLEYSQGWQNINPAAVKFEELVLKHTLEHGANPVLRWNAANVAVKTDSNGNIRPSKAKSTGRIDGISATLNAVGRWIVTDVGKKSATTRHGVLFI